MNTVNSALVESAARIRATLMRDTNGEEDLSLTTIATKLKEACVANSSKIPVKRARAPEPTGFEDASQGDDPAFAKTQSFQVAA